MGTYIRARRNCNPWARPSCSNMERIAGTLGHRYAAFSMGALRLAVGGVMALGLGLTLGACDPVNRVGMPAPDIPIETLDGEKLLLSSLTGSPVVVHFWLPSCHVCAREFPVLEEVRREAADTDVRFLAVSIDPDRPNIRRRAQRLGVGMELLVAKGEVLGPMHVAATPSTAFIDRKGTIVATVNGAKKKAFFERRIRELLE